MDFIDFQRFSFIFIDFHRILDSAVTEQVTRTTRGDAWVVAGTATHRPRAVGPPQTTARTQRGGASERNVGIHRNTTLCTPYLSYLGS